jgi:hypothetical protein
MTGPPEERLAEVLTADLVEEVYGVRAAVGRHPITGRLHVFVYRKGSEGKTQSMC